MRQKRALWLLSLSQRCLPTNHPSMSPGLLDCTPAQPGALASCGDRVQAASVTSPTWNEEKSRSTGVGEDEVAPG